MKGLADKIISEAVRIGPIGVVLVVAGGMKQVGALIESLVDLLPLYTPTRRIDGRLTPKGMAEIRVINGQDPDRFRGLLVDKVIIHDPLCMISPFTLRDLEVIEGKR